MNIEAIGPLVASPATAASSANSKPEQVAGEFDAILWQMLIKESHMFGTAVPGSVDGGGAIGGLLDQVMASQLAKEMDFGIGRAALGLLATETKR